MDSFREQVQHIAHAEMGLEVKAAQLACQDGVFQGSCDMLLPHYAGESLRTILSGRHYKVIHIVDAQYIYE